MKKVLRVLALMIVSALTFTGIVAASAPTHADASGNARTFYYMKSSDKKFMRYYTGYDGHGEKGLVIRGHRLGGFVGDINQPNKIGSVFVPNNCTLQVNGFPYWRNWTGEEDIANFRGPRAGGTMQFVCYPDGI